MSKPDSPAELKRLGREVRAARTAAGLSLRGLGDRIGKTYQLVANIEYGNHWPSVPTLIALRKEIGLKWPCE